VGFGSFLTRGADEAAGQLWEEQNRRWLGGEPNFRLPGGERLAGLLTDLAHEQEGNTLLLTHGLLFGVDLWPFARASTA
jgi:hypothetical protein